MARRQKEPLEEHFLAPFALRSADSGRRYPLENEGRLFDYRSAFQRDRDRIVYSRAFRRLRQKAQAGILPDYEDHRRNRLTHTLEVAQLARTIGRALQLNEDLVESVALGHDLGQPPFGPIGSRALDDLLSGRLDGRGGAGLGDLGGFDRCLQGLAVVDRIEKRYEHPGLNLSHPTREGILKSGGSRFAGIEALEVRAGLPPLFEVQVVILADRLAGAIHDLDDALQSGGVDLAVVERLGSVKQLKKKLGHRYRPRSSRFMKSNAIHRGLTHMLVTGAVLTGRRSLGSWAREHKASSPARFAAVRDEAVQGDEIGLPSTGRRMLDEIEGLLESRVARGYAADQLEARGRRILLGLFAAYHADPLLLDDHLLLRYKGLAGKRFLRDLPRDEIEAQAASYRSDPRYARLLADHLAAMTDGYARAEHVRLSGMGAVPMPSAEQLRREDAGRKLDPPN